MRYSRKELRISYTSFNTEPREPGFFSSLFDQYSYPVGEVRPSKGFDVTMLPHFLFIGGMLAFGGLAVYAAHQPDKNSEEPVAKIETIKPQTGLSSSEGQTALEQLRANPSQKIKLAL